MDEGEEMQVKETAFLQKTAFVIGVVFACLIVIQHRYVFMCYDDYGYASLTYGWTENTAGMDYNFKSVLHFLRWHYLNHGGRILYFFFEIIMFKTGGTALIQIVQAVIIIMISILSGKIVAASIKCEEWQSVSLCLVMYGTLCLRSVRDSVYWYTASVIYVWPLLPMLGCIWLTILMRRKETLLRRCLAVFLAFMAAFSQEQTSVLMIVLIAMLCILVAFGLGQRRWKPLVLSGLLIAAFLGGRLGLRGLYQYRSGIEINEGAPMILYMAMGMQEGGVAPGWYNSYILHIHRNRLLTDMQD